VHGLRGIDLTEPPASAPYPYPPVSYEPRIQQFVDDLNAAGYHPFPAPCGMLNEKDMANSRCIRCRTCDGFPCLVHAKSDAEVLGVRPALQFPRAMACPDRAEALYRSAARTRSGWLWPADLFSMVSLNGFQDRRKRLLIFDGALGQRGWIGSLGHLGDGHEPPLALDVRGALLQRISEVEAPPFIPELHAESPCSFPVSEPYM
jgi:hypothetical protein